MLRFLGFYICEFFGGKRCSCKHCQWVFSGQTWNELINLLPWLFSCVLEFFSCDKHQVPKFQQQCLKSILTKHRIQASFMSWEGECAGQEVDSGRTEESPNLFVPSGSSLLDPSLNWLLSWDSCKSLINSQGFAYVFPSFGLLQNSCSQLELFVWRPWEECKLEFIVRVRQKGSKSIPPNYNCAKTKQNIIW